MSNASNVSTASDVSNARDGLEREVRRFLYREARLLDEERYDEWLALLTDDIHYFVPGIENRARSDPRGTWRPGAMAFFDDGLADLSRRVERLRSPAAWSENPATRHVHVVTNVEAEPAASDEPGDVRAYSVVTSYRSKGESDVDILWGRRTDLLRRAADGGLRLARRTVVIGQSMLLAKNLNTFL